MTSPFTCIKCHVVFKESDSQRQHYKSDWHEYNLKRMVFALPPVTAEEFQRMVMAQRCKNDKLKKTDENSSCKICKKCFSSKNQIENHLMSKKHKDNVLKYESLHNVYVSDNCGNSVKKENEAGISNTSFTNINDETKTDSDVESIDSDEWIADTENPIENNNCLFCNHHSKSLVYNLKHMTLEHSFFIADPEYCIDVKGLLRYLGEKIFASYMCIWCNNTGRKFQSAEAVRTHMRDKGHCKMLHEGEALMEYTTFYDYSSSYPDAENGDPDIEVEIPELDDSDYQLVLPSGNVIGHRSLMRYYKQSINPNGTVAIRKNDKLQKILQQYRALGWTNTQTEIVQKKIRDIKYMQRIQTKYSTKLQFKANKLQKRFSKLRLL